MRLLLLLATTVRRRFRQYLAASLQCLMLVRGGAGLWMCAWDTEEKERKEDSKIKEDENGRGI